MRHAPLARHLARFPALNTEPAEKGAQAVPERRPLELVSAEPTITLTVAELETRVAEARDGALQVLRSQHAAEIETLAAVQAETLVREVEAARATASVEGGRLAAEAIATAFAELRAAVSTDLAAALRPLLAEAVAARAAQALIAALEMALADPSHPALTVCGPAAYLAPIEAALGDRQSISFSPDDRRPEIRVYADGWRAETRMVEALAALEDEKVR